MKCADCFRPIDTHCAYCGEELCNVCADHHVCGGLEPIEILTIRCQTCMVTVDQCTCNDVHYWYYD